MSENLYTLHQPIPMVKFQVQFFLYETQVCHQAERVQSHPAPAAWAAPEASCGGEGPRRLETVELEGP